MTQNALTAAQLADALRYFSNEAITALHNGAADVACIASGILSVAHRLEEIAQETVAVEEGDTKAGETYYTKGKDAEHFERLSDKDFAWALTCAAQDLNDSDENVSEWMPVTALLDGAAERIKATLSASTIPSEPEAKGDAGAGPVGEEAAFYVNIADMEAVKRPFGYAGQIGFDGMVRISDLPGEGRMPVYARPVDEPGEVGRLVEDWIDGWRQCGCGDVGCAARHEERNAVLDDVSDTLLPLLVRIAGRHQKERANAEAGENTANIERHLAEAEVERLTRERDEAREQYENKERYWINHANGITKRANIAEAALAETRGLICDAIGLVPLAHQNWHMDARAALSTQESSAAAQPAPATDDARMCDALRETLVETQDERDRLAKELRRAGFALDEALTVINPATDEVTYSRVQKAAERTRTIPSEPEAKGDAGAGPVGEAEAWGNMNDPRIGFICEECDPERNCHTRYDIGVRPDGKWVCSECEGYEQGFPRPFETTHRPVEEPGEVKRLTRKRRLTPNANAAPLSQVTRRNETTS